MNFTRDDAGRRIFYGRSANRPPRARRSPALTADRRQPTDEPTTIGDEPTTIGAIFRTIVINAIEEHHPAICRQLVREAILLGCERAAAQARGIQR